MFFAEELEDSSLLAEDSLLWESLDFVFKLEDDWRITLELLLTFSDSSTGAELPLSSPQPTNNTVTKDKADIKDTFFILSIMTST